MNETCDKETATRVTEKLDPYNTFLHSRSSDCTFLLFTIFTFLSPAVVIYSKLHCHDVPDIDTRFTNVRTVKFVSRESFHLNYSHHISSILQYCKE